MSVTYIKLSIPTKIKLDKFSPEVKELFDCGSIATITHFIYKDIGVLLYIDGRQHILIETDDIPKYTSLLMGVLNTMTRKLNKKMGVITSLCENKFPELYINNQLMIVNYEYEYHSQHMKFITLGTTIVGLITDYKDNIYPWDWYSEKEKINMLNRIYADNPDNINKLKRQLNYGK